MSRLTSSASPLLALGLLVTPLVTFAQESLFGPIIPQTGVCTCPGSAPNWGCVLQVVQSIINIGIAIAIVVIVVMIAYAGFRLMVAAGNPAAILAARRLLTNALVGLGIILIAWLAVDFVMKAVYDPSTTFEGQNFGPWHSIWASTGEDMCLKVNEDPMAITSGEVAVLRITQAVQSGTLQGGTGACSPANVKNAAARGGATMTDQDAAIIACFAGPESSCGANNQNYCWDKPRSSRCPEGPSTAWGPFQILLSTHSAKFETQACYRAAGTTGPLNCASGFSGGRPIQTPAGRAIVARCQRAAADMICSSVVAKKILDTQGPSAWSGNDDSTSAHQACTVRN